MDSTLSDLVETQVWISVTSIEIYTTLGVLIDVIFTVLNIGWGFGLDTLLL